MMPRRRMLLTVALSALFALDVDAFERVKRTMQVHKVNELGLEIWTEEDPQWETRLTTMSGALVFYAETPASHYPPAGMTWAAPGIQFTAEEFQEGARGAIAAAARRHGLKPRDIAALISMPAAYGELRGYETTFTAVAAGVPVDVKVFFGHRPGMPAVAMQVFTLRGKLPHLSEQIRRSWTNIRYLKD